MAEALAGPMTRHERDEGEEMQPTGLAGPHSWLGNHTNAKSCSLPRSIVLFFVLWRIMASILNICQHRNPTAGHQTHRRQLFTISLFFRSSSFDSLPLCSSLPLLLYPSLFSRISGRRGSDGRLIVRSLFALTLVTDLGSDAVVGQSWRSQVEWMLFTLPPSMKIAPR